MKEALAGLYFVGVGRVSSKYPSKMGWAGRKASAGQMLEEVGKT